MIVDAKGAIGTMHKGVNFGVNVLRRHRGAPLALLLIVMAGVAWRLEAGLTSRTAAAMGAATTDAGTDAAGLKKKAKKKKKPKNKVCATVKTFLNVLALEPTNKLWFAIHNKTRLTECVMDPNMDVGVNILKDDRKKWRKHLRKMAKKFPRLRLLEWGPKSLGYNSSKNWYKEAPRVFGGQRINLRMVVTGNDWDVCEHPRLDFVNMGDKVTPRKVAWFKRLRRRPCFLGETRTLCYTSAPHALLQPTAFGRESFFNQSRGCTDILMSKKKMAPKM